MIKKNITVNLFIIMYKETRRWTLIYVQSISSDNDLIMVIVIVLIETTKIEFKKINLDKQIFLQSKMTFLENKDSYLWPFRV